jgi:hypothetical protein
LRLQFAFWWGGLVFFIACRSLVATSLRGSSAPPDCPITQSPKSPLDAVNQSPIPA